MDDTPAIDCPSEMYIEADSKLSAMQTFLGELRDDPGARTLLTSLVRQLEAVVDTGLDCLETPRLDADPVRRDLDELRTAIDELPTDGVADEATWRTIRARHRDCRNSFSALMDAVFSRSRTRASSDSGIIRPRFAATA